MRVSGPEVSRSSRSTDRARWDPRLFPTSAWISSMMSVCTFGRMRRPPALVSSRYRLSGVVTRMWGGCFVMAARSLVGVSPVRTATRMGTSGRTAFLEDRLDALERDLQVGVDVVAEGLQGGHVDDLRTLGQRSVLALADQVVDGGQEGRQRLAGTRGRRDQRVLPLLDDRPCALLDVGRFLEPVFEPRGHGGMEEVVGHGFSVLVNPISDGPSRFRITFAHTAHGPAKESGIIKKEVDSLLQSSVECDPLRRVSLLPTRSQCRRIHDIPVAGRR